MVLGADAELDRAVRGEAEHLQGGEGDGPAADAFGADPRSTPVRDASAHRDRRHGGLCPPALAGDDADGRGGYAPGGGGTSPATDGTGGPPGCEPATAASRPRPRPRGATPSSLHSETRPNKVKNQGVPAAKFRFSPSRTSSESRSSMDRPISCSKRPSLPAMRGRANDPTPGAVTRGLAAAARSTSSVDGLPVRRVSSASQDPCAGRSRSLRKLPSMSPSGIGTIPRTADSAASWLSKRAPPSTSRPVDADGCRPCLTSKM
jgi:hypothetical protein